MREFKIDFNKAFKWVVLAYAVIFLAGIVACFFGINLDINFSGGTKISYSYTGEIEDKDIEETVKKVIDKSFTVSRSTALAGDTQTFEIALVGKDSVSAETQKELTAKLDLTVKVMVTINSKDRIPTKIEKNFFVSLILSKFIICIPYQQFCFNKLHKNLFKFQMKKVIKYVRFTHKV